MERPSWRKHAAHENQIWDSLRPAVQNHWT